MSGAAQPRRVGVLDVGTNSVRMLIAERDPGGRLREMDRDLVITRLGEGVDGARVLAPEPVRRTVEAIARYTERCRAAGATAVRVAATSAVRDAANRDAFLAAVRDAAGLDADVLSGDEEARLGFGGATADAPGAPPYLVLDIGGGSTEFVRGADRADAWISIDIGSVRLTERHIRDDPPTLAQMSAVAQDARSHLAAVQRAVAPGEATTLVGLAGTITTATALALGLDRYDRAAIHHARLARGDVASVTERLASITSAQRASLPVMPRGREDVIVAGLVILDTVMERFGFAECVVSESDILDGLALDMF